MYLKESIVTPKGLEGNFPCDLRMCGFTYLLITLSCFWDLYCDDIVLTINYEHFLIKPHFPRWVVGKTTEPPLMGLKETPLATRVHLSQEVLT